MLATTWTVIHVILERRPNIVINDNFRPMSVPDRSSSNQGKEETNYIIDGSQFESPLEIYDQLNAETRFSLFEIIILLCLFKCYPLEVEDKKSPC